MTLKTSSNNTWKEFTQTYCWALKKSRGMAALLFLLTFMADPMILLLSAPGWLKDAAEEFNSFTESGLQTAALSLQQIISSYYNSFLKVAIPFSTSLLLLFTLILCIQLFSYMHNKRSVDLFHSLPVGRTPMLLGRWCAGLTVLFVPMIVNTGIAEIVRLSYGITLEAVSAPPLLQMLWALLITMASFTFCLFMAVCSGTTLDTILSILGVNVGYPVLILLGMTIATMIVPGLSFDYRSHLLIITALAPFSAILVPVITEVSAVFPIWWVVLTLLLLSASTILYQKRKSESAENNFAFPIPKIIIRFLLTAVGGIGFGLVLRSIANGFLIGIVTGSVITHIAVEAVYSRGFSHLKKSMKWYGVFAAVFVAFYGVLATGLFGYDTKVPNAQDVASVTVNAGDTDIIAGGGCRTIFSEKHRILNSTITPLLTDQKNIQAVIDTQKKVIEHYRSDSYPYQLRNTASRLLTVTYHMKNGRSIHRDYQYYYNGNSGELVSWEAYNQQLKAITSIPEYIKGTDMIFHVSASDVKSVDVTNSSGQNSFVPDEAAKQQLLDALQQDILNRKLDMSNTRQKEESNISICVNFKDAIPLRDDFVKSQVGSYQGKISLNGGGNYNIIRKDTVTYQLMQKMGWLN